MTVRCAPILLVALHLGSAGRLPAAAPDKDEPTTKPATRRQQLTRQIRIIREAKQPEVAIEAYARGCGLDATNVELRDAYMRRMLRFGRPGIAAYAAQVLVKLQPDNYLAWAVMGYRHGKRKDWIEAYEATAVALEGLAKDPSVLYNAGQLVAWQEGQTPPPKLSDRARRAVAKKRDQLAKTPQFKKGYQAIQAFFAKQAKVAREYDVKIARSAAEISALQGHLRNIDAAMRELKDKIDAHERERRRLRRLLSDTYIRPYYVGPRGRIIYELEESVLVRQYRRDLRDRINREADAIDKLEVDIASLRRKGQPILRDLVALRRAVEKLKKEKARATGGVELAFRWDPPAVDGVVTPEATGPLSFDAGKTRPKATGPEAEAARQLRLARIYLDSQMEQKAAEILDALVARYPKTAAAKKARDLRKTIVPPKGGGQ